MHLRTIILLFLFLIINNIQGYERNEPLIIDHTCTNISLIPQNYIDLVKTNCRLHYAHTSHGSQLTTGAQVIEDSIPLYSFEAGWCSLPNEAGKFCIYDGQIGDNYITPEKYWQSADGMNATRQVLNNNPTINYSMWSWCTQLNYYTEADVQQYLDSLSTLESEFPNITFIYMTGNAQEKYCNEWSSGWNRHLRNEQIRHFCITNNKVLYDFADIDSWYNNEQYLVNCNSDTFPSEHPNYYGDYEWSHTAKLNCIHKGQALWWMMARLSGWSGITNIETPTNNSNDISSLYLSQTFPNPSSNFITINYSIKNRSNVVLKIYNILGQEIKTLIDNIQEPNDYFISWNCKDKFMQDVPNGIYFYSLSTDRLNVTKKLIICR